MISFSELSKRVSATWGTLPDLAKEVFREIAARDLVRYNLEMSKVETLKVLHSQKTQVQQQQGP